MQEKLLIIRDIYIVPSIHGSQDTWQTLHTDYFLPLIVVKNPIDVNGSAVRKSNSLNILTMDDFGN